MYVFFGLGVLGLGYFCWSWVLDFRVLGVGVLRLVFGVGCWVFLDWVFGGFGVLILGLGCWALGDGCWVLGFRSWGRVLVLSVKNRIILFLSRMPGSLEGKTPEVPNTTRIWDFIFKTSNTSL